MKIAIAGSSGQLGNDLSRILSLSHEVLSYSSKELDVTDLRLVKEILEIEKPDVVINAAAYTAVDLAETEVDKAYAVNAMGARNIAIASQGIQAKCCYISTDYVFDGTTKSPYYEYDATNPINVYGKSKSAGERLVQSLSTKYFIVRTSWLYGKNGNNFVNTMLRMGREGKPLKVVHDQVGSPTFTVDLAHFLEYLVQSDCYGIYHATNQGYCTWYEFAKFIFQEAGIAADLSPCTTDEFPRPAARPKYSVMEQMAIRVSGFREFRDWREALQDYLSTSSN